MIGPDENFGGELGDLSLEDLASLSAELSVEAEKRLAAIDILRGYVDNRLSLEQVGYLANELLGEE